MYIILYNIKKIITKCKKIKFNYKNLFNFKHFPFMVMFEGGNIKYKNII